MRAGGKGLGATARRMASSRLRSIHPRCRSTNLSIARGLGSTWAGSAVATERSAIEVRPVAGECVAAPSGACYPVGD